MGDFLKPDKR